VGRRKSGEMAMRFSVRRRHLRDERPSPSTLTHGATTNSGKCRMTSWRPLKVPTMALMVSLAPTPAENATGYHLLSLEDATKHRSNPSLPGTGLARAKRIADTATNFGIIHIKKMPAQPFTATAVFYIFDQDAAGLLRSPWNGLLFASWPPSVSGAVPSGHSPCAAIAHGTNLKRSK
jgi:hypothetical protein